MIKVDLLLINPPFHQRMGGGSSFPLGLGYIISSIEQYGFTYRVINCTKAISSYYEEDLNFLNVFLSKELLKYDPMLVGIGPCMTTEVKALKIIADACKNIYGVERIFAGGPLANIKGQEWVFLEYLGLKYFISGYGEKPVADAIKARKNGKNLIECNGISYANHYVINTTLDVNKLPFPKRLFIEDTRVSIRRSLDKKDTKTLTMITSRGCAYHCNYCVSGSITNNIINKRSSKNIVDEMEYLKNEYGATDIIFYDDCFFFRPAKAKIDVHDFCQELNNRKLGMTWQMEVRVDWLMHLEDESVQELFESGCRQINLGIEKTSLRGQIYVGKVFNIPDLIERIKHMKKISPIKFAGTFILGGADETEKDIRDEIEVSKNMHLEFAHYNPLFIYPGTKVYEDLGYSEKEWLHKILEDKYPWGELVYENRSVSKERLIELTEEAYISFYHDRPEASLEMVKDRFNIHKRLNR